MKSFFLNNSSLKNYILITLGIVIIVLLLAIYYYKGGLKLDFIFGVVICYFVIFLILKNYSFPLIPEVKEESDEYLVYARVGFFVFFVLVIFSSLSVTLL